MCWSMCPWRSRPGASSIPHATMCCWSATPSLAARMWRTGGARCLGPATCSIPSGTLSCAATQSAPPTARPVRSPGAAASRSRRTAPGPVRRTSARRASPPTGVPTFPTLPCATTCGSTRSCSTTSVWSSSPSYWAARWAAWRRSSGRSASLCATRAQKTTSPRQSPAKSRMYAQPYSLPPRPGTRAGASPGPRPSAP